MTACGEFLMAIDSDPVARELARSEALAHRPVAQVREQLEVRTRTHRAVAGTGELLLEAHEMFEERPRAVRSASCVVLLRHR
jgi:hypothetical protein